MNKLKKIIILLASTFIISGYGISDVTYIPNIYDIASERVFYIDGQHTGGSINIRSKGNKYIFIVSSYKLPEIGMLILNTGHESTRLCIKLGKNKNILTIPPEESKILWAPCGEPLFNTNYFYELKIKNYKNNPVYIFFTTDYYRMALLYIEKSHYPAAIPLLKKVIKENPDSIEPLLYLAVSYYNIGNKDKAKEIFSAIDNNPAYNDYLQLPQGLNIDTPVITLIPRAHLPILTGVPVEEGMFFLKESHPPGALVYGPYKRFPKGVYNVTYWLKTDDILCKEIIAKIDIACEGYIIKELDLKGTDFNKKEEFQPFELRFYNPDSTKELEFRVISTGKGNLCVKEIKVQALAKESLKENIKEIHLFWGKMLLEEGNLIDAAKKIRIALIASPNEIEPKLLLAEVLKLQGLTKKAITLYEDILKIAPNYEEALINLNKLQELTPSNQFLINFADLIEFKGYDLEKPDGLIKITYFWKPIRYESQSYMIFVHFRHNGKIIFQNDHYLQEYIPTQSPWIPGEVIKEEYNINIPPDAPKGEYKIVIGMWNPNTKKRLQIKNIIAPNNEIEIGLFKV